MQKRTTEKMADRPGMKVEKLEDEDSKIRNMKENFESKKIADSR